jgi:hypothetical protein
VERLLGQMVTAFPDAEITGYQLLIDGLTCDPKDRHVLAAAVRSAAEAIVTFNTDDFPDHSVEEFDLGVIHPDSFLLDLLDLAPCAVVEELTQQAAANRRTPGTLPSSSTRSNERASQRSLRRSEAARANLGDQRRLWHGSTSGGVRSPAVYVAIHDAPT